MKETNKKTAAEIVAALKRHEIDAAEIVATVETVARWVNFIDGEDVETVRTFKPGEVVTLGEWRPEGMTAHTEDGREMFVFWRYLEAMTKPTDADEVRAVLVESIEKGESAPGWGAVVEAASRADVRGAVEAFGADMSHYEKSARAFLTLTGARFSARFLGFFDSRDEWGEDDGASGCRARGYIPVWRVSLSSASGRMSVRFRGSIVDGNEGREAVGVYSVLSCLTKSAPGTFDEFAREFGYFPISSGASYRHAVKVWRACRREFVGVCRVWPGEEDRDALALIY